jgi:hypothetical protein
MTNVVTTARLTQILRLAAASLMTTCLLPLSSPATAAEDATPEAISQEEAATAAQAKLNQGFAKLLSGATMKGSFTVDRDAAEGQPAKPPREEEYAISSATHLGGELWLITSRIRYGDVDATVPVPVVVKWAGSTPVITLDEVTLPGMGTFSARVLFHGNRYAGTWQHDAVGGLMFGRVEPKTD